jgi:G3E family GTPase
LITGFLGSGKTTFLRRYADYLLRQGLRVGILENDYGAVNVDVMLLQELEGDNCGVEAVAGGCCEDCHRRRFKTKLIALAMSGYDRVIIEPSGIFDVDEFFDALHEPPLDRWYEIGSVITVVDATLEEDLSENSLYLLASQAASAGTIVLSKAQSASEEQLAAIPERLNAAAALHGCQRRFDNDILSKPWEELTDDDFAAIMRSGWHSAAMVKRLTSSDGAYQSVYFLNSGMDAKAIRERVPRLFTDKACGSVFRVKGFFWDDGWQELNSTAREMLIQPIPQGQDVLIVIGEDLNEAAIKSLLKL